jgi:hypothetical protein
MNKVGLIASNDILLNRIIDLIGEENKDNILVEYLNDDTIQNETILDKINLLNDKKADFIIFSDIDLFVEFDYLQDNSPLLILNPIDTLVLSVGGDLNQFPLWVLDNRLAKRLMDLHGFSYQVADKTTKDNLAKLKNTTLTKEEITEIINIEVSRYKPYGVDSIVFTDDYNTLDIKELDEVDLYKIEYAYIKEIVNLLNK